MARYEKLNHNIVCIDTEQNRDDMAASYLIGSDGHYAFIECGTSLSVPSLLEVLDDLGIERKAVDYVMPTHVHLDHAGGAGMLMRELPDAQMIIHPRGKRHMVDPSKLIAGATAVYGEAMMAKLYGEIVAVPEQRVTVADVSDGKEFSLMLGSRELVFIDAPGHARHHYAIWDATSRGWFTGDVFGLSYRNFDDADGPYLMPTTTPVQFDPPAWEDTLQRLLARRPECVYLTHYSRVDNIDKLAGDLRDGLAAYQKMAHRHAAAQNRYQAIFDALMAYHIGQLHTRNSNVPDDRIRELLGMDVGLNAQGLEIWLDKMAA